MNTAWALHSPIPPPEHPLSTHVAKAISPQPPSSPSQSDSDSLPSESEFQDLIQRYPFAAEASYFTRANRYHGPASTWRSWTADDRAVTYAVDQERAEDLSAHLYNAFALRKKAQTSNFHRRESLLSPKSRSDVTKTTATNIDEPTSQQAFIPPRLWTAWPLRGYEVPRRNRNGQSINNHNAIAGVQPSGNLEEALIAITLRHAKNKWNIRESDPVPKPLGRKKRDWKIEREITMQQLIDSGAVKRTSSIDQELDVPDVNGPPALDHPDEEEMFEDDIDAPGGTQTFTSQAFHIESSSSSESDNTESKTENSDYEPVFSADDNEARRLLMPSTRHILSKLDDLLLGLHKARKAYASRDSNIGASASISASASASLSHSRARPANIPAGTGVEEKEDQYLRTGTYRSRTKRLRQEHERGRKRQRTPPAVPPHPAPFGLRDWSDVIGMATLTGWKTDTVARAAERCARLFDENMMFRTFHDLMQDGKEDLHPSYSEEYAYVSPESTETDSDDDDPMPLNPVSTIRYVRTSSPCARCRTLSFRCDPPAASFIRSAEAIPSAASTFRISCAACPTSQDPSMSTSTCSGINIKLTDVNPNPNPTSTSRTCPHPSCWRHTHPFKKRYHLERHLHEVHRANTDTKAQSQTAVPIPVIVRTKPTTPERMEPMRVGKDLACPVPTCQRHTHNYSRAARLYAHIKREHPDIDLQRFRELVSRRGESRRGKYDRSKTRSKSGSRRRGSSAVDSDVQGIVGQGEEGAEESSNGTRDDEEEEEEGEERENVDDNDDDDNDDENEEVIEMVDYSENEKSNGNEHVDESAAAAAIVQHFDVEEDDHPEQSDESM